ncbi:hypothetical protein ACOME3_008520 [Neoechinorhynchus agilis]
MSPILEPNYEIGKGLRKLPNHLLRSRVGVLVLWGWDRNQSGFGIPSEINGLTYVVVLMYPLGKAVRVLYSIFLVGFGKISHKLMIGRIGMLVTFELSSEVFGKQMNQRLGLPFLLRTPL